MPQNNLRDHIVPNPGYHRVGALTANPSTTSAHEPFRL